MYLCKMEISVTMINHLNTKSKVTDLKDNPKNTEMHYKGKSNTSSIRREALTHRRSSY